MLLGKHVVFMSILLFVVVEFKMSVAMSGQTTGTLGGAPGQGRGRTVSTTVGGRLRRPILIQMMGTRYKRQQNVAARNNGSHNLSQYALTILTGSNNSMTGTAAIHKSHFMQIRSSIL